MIGKTIQNIRATIIFIFCILIYFFLMETIFFLTHLIGRNLWWILVNDDVGNFEKTQVKEDLSFPPLEVGFLKVKGLVEISNRLIWFLLCRLHVLNLLNCWCKHNNNGNITKNKPNNTLNIINLKIRTRHFLDWGATLALFKEIQALSWLIFVTDADRL